ncbi:MAG: rhodanese-like domain-containing protein [Gammaproteobacteria bacterium]|nr:rhodanese-like domain-containing protein [Gammaproteobacteria bacterium]
MKKFIELVAESAKNVTEIFPWDLEERFKENPSLLLLDIREPYEYEAMHIKNSINVPRGVLETACEYDYEETVTELVEARDKEIIVACRSGNRSIFACEVMQKMGYQNVVSLKTGLRGWSDYEQPLFDKDGNEISEDDAIDYFTSKIREDQMNPK